MDIKILALALASMLFMSFSSQAMVYQYTDSDAASVNERINSISTTYDDVNQIFTWDVTLNPGTLDVDGFWLVVNDGAMPHHRRKEAAIMYGDLENNILTTYVYNPKKGVETYKRKRLYLQTDEITSTENAFSFSIDTSSINAWKPEKKHYDGISFDENIGIWFFLNAGTHAEYKPNGKLKYFSQSDFAEYDVEYRQATVVPVPAAAWLFAPAIMLLGGLRKRS